jgi:hypothetical protein
VRIRSLAERTRYQVFSCLGSTESTSAGVDDGEEQEEEINEPWMLEAAKVYEKSLMLLAEQDPDVEEEFSC